MPQLIVDVPQNVWQRVLKALCSIDGYQDKINGKTNPESQEAFCKRKLAERLNERVLQYEASAEAQMARETAWEKAAKEIKLS